MEQLLPPPIVYAAECSQRPPREIEQKYFSRGLLANIGTRSPEEQSAFLWSRLIIKSAPYQFWPSDPPELVYDDIYADSFEIKGATFKFCSVSWKENWVTVALSTMPINVCIEKFDWTKSDKERARQKYETAFNYWIDRQPDPDLAFYQLYTAKQCLMKRRNPTVKIVIEDDELAVVGATVAIREDLQFWRTPEWICAVQGPAITAMLSEIRTPKKTLGLLDGTYVDKGE
ncbi:MAG: hypothetical protein LUC43_05105 [Burkholderiales bacterium]|nr:hypothetical protein [Burkholderiales bacterium]